jgi:hypothetical protein
MLSGSVIKRLFVGVVGKFSFLLRLIQVQQTLTDTNYKKEKWVRISLAILVVAVVEAAGVDCICRRVSLLFLPRMMLEAKQVCPLCSR